MIFVSRPISFASGKKTISRQTYLVFHCLIKLITITTNGRHTTCLDLHGLRGLIARNLRRLAYKFDLDQRDRKSTEVHAKPDQAESQVDPGF